MSWIERAVEQRLAKAVANGELDTPELKGRRLDLDAQRSQGWWADQFARRELSHDRREAAEEAIALARAGFWRASDVDELRRLVNEANAVIERANVNMIATDQLDPFDPADIEDRWRRLRA